MDSIGNDKILAINLEIVSINHRIVSINLENVSVNHKNVSIKHYDLIELALNISTEIEEPIIGL